MYGIRVVPALLYLMIFIYTAIQARPHSDPIHIEISVLIEPVLPVTSILQFLVYDAKWVGENLVTIVWDYAYLENHFSVKLLFILHDKAA